MSRHLKAALLARNRALADAALANWVGARTDRAGLQSFMDACDGQTEGQSSAALPTEALGLALHAASRGLAVISIAEYRKRIART